MLARSHRSWMFRSVHIGLVLAATVSAFAACDLEQPDGVPGARPDNTSSATTGASSSSRAASVSSTTTGNGAGGAVGGFALGVDNPAPELDLAATVDLVVTVTPSGYAGDVALSVPDLSGSGVTASLGATTLTLDGATAKTTTLTLTTATNAAPGALGVVVTGSTSSGENQAMATLLVRSAITITIPAGVDGLGGTPEAPVTNAFGPYPMTIVAPSEISAASPVTVRFFNADAVAHSIHADQNGQGFGHSINPIAPNAMDQVVREISAAGTYDYYIHDQQLPIVVGRIVVE